MSKKRKICPVCGTDYPEDYAFCGQCVDEEGNSIRLIKETDTELPKSQVTLSSSSPKKV